LDLRVDFLACGHPEGLKHDGTMIRDTHAVSCYLLLTSKRENTMLHKYSSEQNVWVNIERGCFMHHDSRETEL
jgi:hypothetical protein